MPRTKTPAKVQNNTPLAPLPLEEAGNKKTYYTAKERVAYHREQANEAFKTDDKVKAYGHVKAHGRAKDQLNWFMRKTPEEKAAYIAGKK